MIRMAVLGCGRIGRMHARNITAHERASLAMVYDLHSDSAEAVGQAFSATVAADPGAIFASPDVDAVLVAAATPTHADYIEMAVSAGKPVLCEKPIDLSLERVNACGVRISKSSVPVQIGFNRRFDPGHRAARDAVQRGEIGDLHQVVITSRDPEMPPRGYYAEAGGLFRDMTIHDFDLARFMLGEEPVEVMAMGSTLIDPEMMAELGDHDTGMIVMRTASGKQCHINNSRTAVYGYDQRVELLGTRGMIQSGNKRQSEVRRFRADHTEQAEPYQYFFVERYEEAFMAELDAFVDCVENGTAPQVGFEDGKRALMLAEAAYLSIRERRVVAVEEIA